MNFKDLSCEWFEERKKYLKESTEAYYIYELQNYVFPALGEINVT